MSDCPGCFLPQRYCCCNSPSAALAQLVADIEAAGDDDE